MWRHLDYEIIKKVKIYRRLYIERSNIHRENMECYVNEGREKHIVHAIMVGEVWIYG